MEYNNTVDHSNFYENQTSITIEKQKNLHETYKEYDKNCENKELNMNFVLEPVKSLWEYTYEKTAVKINNNEKSEISRSVTSKYKFRIDQTADILYGGQLNQKIPSIVFNDGYTGKWTNMLGNVLLRNSTFSIKNREKPIQECNNAINYINICESPDYENILIEIGEVPELTTQSLILPEYKLVIKPMSIFSGPNRSFPIYLTSEQDELYVTVEVIDDMGELLLIYDENNNQIKNPDLKKCIKYINGNSIDGIGKFNLEDPEYTFFYQRRDSDLNEAICNDKNVTSKMTINGQELDVIKISYENYNTNWSINPSNLDRIDVISNSFLKNEAPYRFDFLIQNHTAELNNDHTNFTTNSSNKEKGYDPFSHVQILVDDIQYTEKIPKERLNKLANNISIRKHKGIGSIHNTSNGIYTQSGIVGKQFKLNVSLSDQNNYLNCYPNTDPKSKDYLKSQDQFKTCFITRYTDYLIFIKYPKNKEERKENLCHIL